MEYLSIAFILLVLAGFVTWKVLRFGFRMLKNGCRAVIKAITAKHRERERFPIIFPDESYPEYSISQNEFSRIATRTAYRHQRVEDVDVNGNTVSITIISQTGLSKSHANISFILSGRDIGNFRINRDNFDTTIPEKIGERIRIEVRKQVGLEA